MNARIKQLAAVFKHHKIDAFLVTKSINITYLSGFPAAESWLLVTPLKSFYITDFRYLAEAKRGLPGISIRCYAKSLAATLFDIVRAGRLKRIGFDADHVTLAQYQDLRRQCPHGRALVRTRHLVEDLREVKDKKEIQKIRRALGLHRRALQILKKIVRPGRSEREIVYKLEQFVKAAGADFSFPPIVASGPHSSFPHAKITGRRIRPNDLVLVDIGIDSGGYKSDLTRMFFLGKIPRFIRDVHDKVAAAQRKAIEKVRAGVCVAEVDRQARNYLAKHGLAKFFGHALGHGVGLEIHESPRLSQKSSAILKEGMVITIEPAVYIPNRFGIRIEDMVLVKKEGCEILSGSIA